MNERIVNGVSVPMTDAEVTAMQTTDPAAAAASAKAADTMKLRDGGEKIAFVLVELVDKLIAKGAIAATDFTPAVRQVYQDVKTIADRVKP